MEAHLTETETPLTSMAVELVHKRLELPQRIAPAAACVWELAAAVGLDQGRGQAAAVLELETSAPEILEVIVQVVALAERERGPVAEM